MSKWKAGDKVGGMKERYTTNKKKRFKRQRLFEKQRGACYYCGKPMLLAKGPADARLRPSFATIDHVIPKAKGGTMCYDNCVLACQACNCERGDKDAREFMLEKAGMI